MQQVSLENGHRAFEDAPNVGSNAPPDDDSQSSDSRDKAKRQTFRGKVAVPRSERKLWFNTQAVCHQILHPTSPKAMVLLYVHICVSAPRAPLNITEPSTLDPQPSTLNPQPSTLNPQPQTNDCTTTYLPITCSLALLARS
jgi:hypothetical protein